MSSDPFHLRRFVGAQADIYDSALAELLAGRKRGHWMWFVFPQLKGLGASTAAACYGLGSLSEARAYASHAILGPRLTESFEAALTHAPRGLRQIFGTPDDLKFRSSATLFARACPDQPVFVGALDAFCPDGPDPRTMELLSRESL